MTLAALEIARLQKEYPPWTLSAEGSRVDHVKQYYVMLQPNLPKWANEMYQSNKLVVGEEGMHKPDAYRKFFAADGSHAILITSGYLRLFNAVASDLMACATLLPNGKKVAAPLLSQADAIVRVASVLRQFKDGYLSEGHALDLYPVKLDDYLRSCATDLTDGAGLFMLAHELGHVAITVGGRNPELTSEEKDADVVAFALLLAASERLNLGTMYAGAFFSLRLHACLERAGFHFLDQKASLSDRTDWLKGSVRAWLNRLNPVGMAWIEVVVDQLLTAVEALLLSWSTQDGQAQPSASAAVQDDAASESSTTPRKTQAMSEMERLVQANPPWEMTRDGLPLDRTKTLLRLLESITPERIQSMRASGHLVIAEVGESDPRIVSQDFADGSHAIIVNSALFAVIEAVSRFLHTRTAVTVESGETVPATAPLDETAQWIAGIFHEANAGEFPKISYLRPGLMLPLDDIPNTQNMLADAQEALAFELAEGAGAFMLMSEIYRTIGNISANKGGRPSSEGMAAFAFSLAVPWIGFRKTYAASLFALRVSALIGLSTSQQPQMNLTVEQLRAVPWRILGSHAAFEYMTNIGNRYDRLMEIVSRALQGQDVFVDPGDYEPIKLDLALENRLWLRESAAWVIAGGIYESVMGDKAPDGILPPLVRLIDDLSEDSIRQLAEALIDRVLLKAGQPSYTPDQLASERKFEVLRSLITQLKEPARSIFVAAASKKMSSGTPNPAAAK